MTTDTELEQITGTELCTTTTTTRTDRGPGMHWSYRTDRRLIWVGRHSPELAGVIGPVVLAVLFWHWAFAVLAVVVAVLWGRHEYRQRTRPDKSGAARPGALTPDQAGGTHTPTGTPNAEEDTRGSA